MKVVIGIDKYDMAKKAADCAAAKIREAIAAHGEVRIVVASAASQFEFFENLTAEPDIDWSCVTGFHLDEYVGLPATHPASFRGYMRKRFLSKVSLRAFNEVNGDTEDPMAEIARLTDLLNVAPIDVACVGIGENGHLAFNDPPADFETDCAYKIVNLDRVCRMQQVGEGWFATLDDVPTQAFSMTVPQILKSRSIVCTVPDARKALAVKGSVEGPVSNRCPASILQTHADCALFLDPPAAGLLSHCQQTGFA